MMINIPDELVKQLQIIANQEQRSVEDVVVHLVSMQIKHVPTNEASEIEGFDIDHFLKVLDENMQSVVLTDDINGVVENSREILHKIMGEHLQDELGEDE